MSIAAWPSIEPAIPRSACARASRTSRSRSSSRNSTASRTIITGPPVNSARVNCQPMSRARITPSSITRLVEAISNAIAAVKLAPLRSSDRASATAAYEQDDDAAPRPAATASVRGRSSPSSRTMVDFGTRAWITADSANPRISAQVISQAIDPVMDSACAMARIRFIPSNHRLRGLHDTPWWYIGAAPGRGFMIAKSFVPAIRYQKSS